MPEGVGGRNTKQKIGTSLNEEDKLCYFCKLCSIDSIFLHIFSLIIGGWRQLKLGSQKKREKVVKDRGIL